MNLFRAQVVVCGGTGCSVEGAMDIINKFKNEFKKHNIENEIEVVRTGCLGLCDLGPIVIIYPEGTFYSKVKVEDVSEIVEEHLVNGRVVKRIAYYNSINDYGVRSLNNVGFYKKQHRIALKNCGVIDPENIDEYLAFDGYKALEKALTTMKPDEVIDTMKKSGLRGRGGGGFPTGLKWEAASKQLNDEKYIVCNADEGDPGAFMDRSVLEGDPHSVLEAMAIGGYAIGANEGYIYIRAEYPLAVERLDIAIKQAREYGLLGDNILGTGFNFNIHLRLGAGAFVCGEETALMNSIEGKRGMPNPKPPFPAVSGLWKKPTVINNVETYANIPQVILKGHSWFSSIGTEKSKGTKVFALGGKITNAGLVEVPMGITLKEVIYDIGGGIPNGKNFKAAQTGGPSGGCITEENLETPIDYDSLTALGSMMGLRPDRATIVYCNKIRETFKNIPIIIGGIEASLRRFAHYDYWSDKVRKSILVDSSADLLVYGMSEKQIVTIANYLRDGIEIKELTGISGTCYMTNNINELSDYIEIPSYKEVCKDKFKYAEAFKIQYDEQDPIRGKTVVQKHTNGYLVQNKPEMPLSREELDKVYALPYAKEYHPIYEELGGIPAIEEVKFSLVSSRGCFGSCAFCAITFHQGRIVQSRSEASILEEAEEITKFKDFKGYIHDVGGPTAITY